MRAREILAVIGHETLERKIDFPDQHTGIEFIDHAPHLRDHAMDFSLIGGVERENALTRRPALAKIRIGRIVAKLRILDQMPDHIDPEAVDPFPKPEAHDVINGLAHRGIAPVQIRLLAEEGVIIILPGRGVVFPGAAAEFRQPVVRRPAVPGRLAPDVPVALWITACTPPFAEPGPPVARTIRHALTP